MIIRSLLALVFLCSVAQAQTTPNNVNGPVRQLGQVVAGHTVTWVGNNIIQDSGGSGGGGVSSFAFTNANGASGSVATATTTPTLTLTPTAGGTFASSANNLGFFAATTSAQLAGVISDETGTGALVFANTPTLVTPVIGAATGTSLSLSGLTQGSVIYAGAAGALSQNNANFFWDNTNTFLGIGTSARYNSAILGIYKSSSTTPAIEIGNNVNGAEYLASFQSGRLMISQDSGTAFDISSSKQFNIWTNSTQNTPSSGIQVLTMDTSGHVGVDPNGNTINSVLAVFGNVAVGTSYISSTAPANGLIVQGNVGIGTSTATGGILTVVGLATGTNADFLCLSAANVVLVQTSACTISSMRFKENIHFYANDALPQIEALRPVTFTMKPNDTPNADINFGRKQIGLIAEEVEKVNPLLAVYEQDGKTPKSYRQESVIALLVKGLQEEQAEIDVLKHGQNGHRCYGIFWCGE